MNQVLMLNATYEPLRFISLKRAMVLVLKEKAEVLEAKIEQQLRAERVTFPYPLVIRLVTYVPVPRRVNIPLTRRNLLSRDGYTCQYCGATGLPLTVDHVIPQSRGGKTEWGNCVAACEPCNRKKGNRLTGEARMFPRTKPVKPGYLAVVLLGEARSNEVWKQYISA